MASVSLSLPPGKTVSFETTLVPLPAHLEPHLSPKGKGMLKISQPVSRKHGGGGGGRGLPPQVKGRVRTGGRCWFLWTQKCPYSCRHLSQPGKRQLVAFASLTYLFKRLQLLAKFKCCSKIRTYKVSQPGPEGFRLGKEQEQCRIKLGGKLGRFVQPCQLNIFKNSLSLLSC